MNRDDCIEQIVTNTRCLLKMRSSLDGLEGSAEVEWIMDEPVLLGSSGSPGRSPWTLVDLRPGHTATGVPWRREFWSFRWRLPVGLVAIAVEVETDSSHTTYSSSRDVDLRPWVERGWNLSELRDSLAITLGAAPGKRSRALSWQVQGGCSEQASGWRVDGWSLMARGPEQASRTVTCRVGAAAAWQGGHPLVVIGVEARDNRGQMIARRMSNNARRVRSAGEVVLDLEFAFSGLVESEAIEVDGFALVA